MTSLSRSWRTVPRSAGLFLVVVSLMWSVPASGHHSLTEYDDTQVKTIEGTLIDLHMKNPHSVLTVQASGPGADRWTVEWLAVLVLRRQGVDETTLKPGDRVIVTGHPSRNRDDHKLWLRTVTRLSDRWMWTGGF